MTETDATTSNTRSAVLALLKRQGPQSAGELAKSLSLTPMAARLQLYGLETEGYVSSEPRPAGRGRPTLIWSLTDSSADVFPDAHQGLALEMIESVRALFGEAGLDKVINRHSDVQRSTYAERLKGANTLGDKVKRLAKARADEGYMAEAKRDGSAWMLIENHCPICAAASACTRLCARELEVFQATLGNDVLITREDHILAGARRCAYRVSSRT